MDFLVDFLKRHFGRNEQPAPNFEQFTRVAGVRHLHSIVRERDGHTVIDLLFLRPQPDIDTDLLVAAVSDALPGGKSLMVTAGTEADESFDYYRVTVQSFDLVTAKDMKDLADHIDAQLNKPAPSQEVGLPARTFG